MVLVLIVVFILAIYFIWDSIRLKRKAKRMYEKWWNERGRIDSAIAFGHDPYPDDDLRFSKKKEKEQE